MKKIKIGNFKKKRLLLFANRHNISDPLMPKRCSEGGMEGQQRVKPYIII